jgi:hypothetical protein
MGSYGYHVVSFDGESKAVEKAKLKLAEGLPEGWFDDEPDPMAEEVYYCGPGYSHIVDETMTILERLTQERGLGEIRYHAAEGDANASHAWRWTEQKGGWMLDGGVFTLTFGTARAVDRVVCTGDGLAELAGILLSGPEGTMGVEDLAEAVGIAGLLVEIIDPETDGGQDWLPRETLLALAAWFRRTVESNDELLPDGWLEEDGKSLLLAAVTIENGAG